MYTEREESEQFVGNRILLHWQPLDIHILVINPRRTYKAKSTLKTLRKDTSPQKETGLERA